MTCLPATTKTFESASSIPEKMLDALKLNALDSNMMYSATINSRTKGPSPGEWWIFCGCRLATSTPVINFVLSCFRGSLGNYPIFIYSAHLPSDIAPDYLSDQMLLMVEALFKVVPKRRVFSVFAPAVVARSFSEHWAMKSGIARLPDSELYYHAKLAHCTKNTLVKHHETSLPPNSVFKHKFELANENDVAEVAELCHQFALTAEPFTLTTERAAREAEILIGKGQLWVCRIGTDERDLKIGCIATVTREGGGVSTITKVYTAVKWRGKKCATRLTSYVCDYLLNTKGAEKVALFVGVKLKGAVKVYHDVGFVGLAGVTESMDGPDVWLEIGFDRTKVDLGHW